MIKIFAFNSLYHEIGKKNEIYPIIWNIKKRIRFSVISIVINYKK